MAISGLIAGGMDQALEQVLERRLQEAIRQQREKEHADQVSIQRDQLAGIKADRTADNDRQRRVIDLAELKRVDDLGREATQRNAASDMAGVLAMPGMSNEAKASEIMGSGLRTGSVDPVKVIEGLTRVPPPKKFTPPQRLADGSIQQFEEGNIPQGTKFYQEPKSGPAPDFEWVTRNGTPMQIRKGSAQPGDRPYEKGAGGDGTAQSYRADKSNSVIRKINDLLGDPADPQSKSRINSRTAGVVGSALAHAPWNTEARDVSAELQSLAADLAFEQLQKMRDASKTGGALGQVSNIELDLLKNAEASIRQDQSPANLTRQLGIIRDSAMRFDAAVEKFGGLDPMKPATSTGGGKRLRFDRTGKPIP